MNELQLSQAVLWRSQRTWVNLLQLVWNGWIAAQSGSSSAVLWPVKQLQNCFSVSFVFIYLCVCEHQGRWVEARWQLVGMSALLSPRDWTQITNLGCQHLYHPQPFWHLVSVVFHQGFSCSKSKGRGNGDMLPWELDNFCFNFFFFLPFIFF